MLEMLFMNCPADTAASTKLGPTPCSTSAHRHCQGCFYDKVRPRHADGLLHLALRRAPPHPTATTPRAHSERRMQRSPSHSLKGHQQPHNPEVQVPHLAPFLPCPQ